MTGETNKARLDKMLGLLGQGLPVFVEGTLEKHYGKNWRQYAQMPEHSNRAGKLDVQAHLRLIQNEWREVFARHLSHSARDAATAANAGRNAWAHAVAGSEVADDETLRALSGAAQLLEAVKSSKAGEARELANAFMAAVAERSKPKAKPAAEAAPRPTLTLRQESAPAPAPVQQALTFNEGRQVGALEAWRFIAPPREDITAGRLTLDHFAANLAVVDRNEVGGAYGDADEFFRATHMTGGLKLVLESGASRLARGKGPSVIGLQTNFGGGKTHTMLALLHLVRAKDPAALNGVKELLGQGASLKGAKAVAFSGSDKGPDVPLEHAGKKPIRTIWGYLAYRLAGDAGLALIAGAEEAGTNPGGEALQKVLKAAGGPALILLDEIVSYVKQLKGESYEAHLAFFQSLTEAATRVPQALVVGSLPESEDEFGGDRGKETLQRLERLFGRLQSSWQAAQGTETYAIVRRRLFQELDEKGVAARDKTIEAYRKLYRDNKKDFPAGVGDAGYAELMREAYPVHPMLFDKLAQEWGSLDRFQRTRGVLKFVAESARRIWIEGRNDPLIQLGSIPLADPAVRGAVIEPLEGPAWAAIVDGEVESDRAQPFLLDNEKRRYGDHRVATRAARAVFLGTAPSGDARGGMSGADIRLACAMPEENVSVFGDALSELVNRSGHLRSDANGYWFGSEPTLRKIAEARSRELSDADADEEIGKALEQMRRPAGGFGKVHITNEPREVEESSSVALVILLPNHPHDPRSETSAALSAAEDAVKRRPGDKQRQARNTLIFLAADTGVLGEARKAAKMLKAWSSVSTDRSLDLKDSQKEDVARSLATAKEALNAAVRRAWSHIIIPVGPRSDGEPFSLDRAPLRGTASKSLPQNVWDRIVADGHVQEKLGRISLADRVKENWPGGADHLSLTTIRDWFVQFVRFERLRDEFVLADALSELIRDGLSDYAYADGIDADGKYRGLAIGKVIPIRFDGAGLLVKRAAADAQLKPIEPAPDTPPRSGPQPPTDGPPLPQPEPSPQRILRRFYGSVALTPEKPVREIQQIVDGLIGELLRTDGVKLSLRLEIEATAPGGFSANDAAIIRDNAKTLKFKPDDTGFSED